MSTLPILAAGLGAAANLLWSWRLRVLLQRQRGGGYGAGAGHPAAGRPAQECERVLGCKQAGQEGATTTLCRLSWLRLEFGLLEGASRLASICMRHYLSQCSVGREQVFCCMAGSRK